MTRIKILSPHEAQKIAAGEVIERPANVVKELIENSIDAQASKISLYVEKAGKKLIRVIDNGCGMSPDDALLSVQPHATSKITSLHDLTSLATFGFRGEGLTSISAVSKLALKTRVKNVSLPEENNEGVHGHGIALYLEANTLISQQEVSCQPGTEIAVQDLFFNTPVRKKFLKQDDTEWHQIQHLMQAFALMRKDIHFVVYHDDKLIINAPSVSTIKDRISQIWDYNFSQNMLELSPDEHITGMISNNHFWRYGRQHIFFFVNNRWVKNAELSKALLNSYRNIVPPGKFPAAFMFITVDPQAVDINVHPKKEEVRFAKQGPLLNTLEMLIKKTLEQQINRVLSPTPSPFSPHLSVEKQYLPEATNSPFTLPQAHRFPDTTSSSKAVIKPLKEFNDTKPLTHALTGLETLAGEPTTTRNWDAQPLPTMLKEPPIYHQHQEKIPTPAVKEFSVIGQLLETYILIENEQGLVIIDAHAAHERILYEKMKSNYEKKEGTHLLFPEVVTLSARQVNALTAEQEFLANQGIEFTPFGATQIKITATPPNIRETVLKEFIVELATFLEENEMLDQTLFRKKLNEHVHSHLACKTAVKAGDRLTLHQMHQLVSDLLTTENRFQCIHGRPTLWAITSDELAKKFRRK